MAEVGGNISSAYSPFFKRAPFTFRGKTIGMTHRFATTAPLVHQVDVEVSVNGGPFLPTSPWPFTRKKGCP